MITAAVDTYRRYWCLRRLKVHAIRPRFCWEHAAPGMVDVVFIGTSRTRSETGDRDGVEVMEPCDCITRARESVNNNL